ncbi:chaplin [Streptomyces sp. RB6PN25]|uniref:Chaplin n=1 Tax=Streptomyces humicola TaxID=2953240 RepID=A0ABT1Q2I2_9ACTN|nr:chaplin [Streptomyces humicola]MCQ4084133.1 chaplin [Streptomyces humicola]
MRQVAKKGLMTMVATSGVLAVTSGLAYADAGAQGVASDSPGVLSGNQVQIPVHVPVNACGNTVDVIGALNPTFGNHCVNSSSHRKGSARSEADAEGVAKGSPGVGSGNNVQVPVHVPVNACGNSVDVIGALNPAFGDDCQNESSPGYTPRSHTPLRHIPRRHHRPSETVPWIPPYHHDHHVWHGGPELAHTGTDMLGLAAIPASAGLLIGGVLLYRRGRRSAARG